MVSVIMRSILVQLATPDEMRGRVNAVDMIFIGVSNELGQFESGLTAHWFGTVPAVVLGGVGTLVVIGIWAWAFPELRNADQIDRLSRTCPIFLESPSSPNVDACSNRIVPIFAPTTIVFRSGHIFAPAICSEFTRSPRGAT